MSDYDHDDRDGPLPQYGVALLVIPSAIAVRNYAGTKFKDAVGINCDSPYGRAAGLVTDIASMGLSVMAMSAIVGFGGSPSTPGQQVLNSFIAFGVNDVVDKINRFTGVNLYAPWTERVQGTANNAANTVELV